MYIELFVGNSYEVDISFRLPSSSLLFAIDRTQSACKLGVSCRVNRRYHVHWLIETSFGPAYEADIDASDGFYNLIPPFLLLRRVPPAIRRLRTRVILLLTTIIVFLTRTT